MFDAAPAGDNIVVGAGIFGPAFALTKGVEAVRQLSGGLGLSSNAGEDLGGAAVPFSRVHADQVVQRLPDRQAGIGLRIPVGRVFLPAVEPDLAAARFDDASFFNAIDAGGLGLGEGVGFAKLAFVPAVLLEPSQAELSVGVEVVFGEEAVDELEGGLDGHR